MSPALARHDVAGYVVELNQGCWLAPWTGDPGRTLVIEHATIYETRRGARVALGMARRYRPFINAAVRTLRAVPAGGEE